MDDTICQEVLNIPDSNKPFNKSRVKLDINVRRDNFKAMVKLLEATNLTYWITAGTLLGAIRDKDLIEWDIDTDIGIFSSERKEFIELIKAAEKEGFEFFRAEADDALISLIRNGEYIDFYRYIKGQGYYGCSAWRFGEKHFKFDTIELLGCTVPIPQFADEFLSRLYGDWKTPRKGVIANPYVTADGSRSFHE